MFDIKSIAIWTIGYELGKKAQAAAAAANQEAHNEATMPLNHHHHLRGRNSIHSIEQVRNKKINSIAFAFLFILFLVDGLAFLSCHFLLNESSASCSRLTAVMTVGIIMVFLVTTTSVNCYRRRKKRRRDLEESECEQDESLMAEE